MAADQEVCITMYHFLSFGARRISQYCYPHDETTTREKDDVV